LEEPVKHGQTTGAYWLQDIPIKEEVAYVVGGWLKTDNITGPGGVRIAVHWKGPGNTWIGETKFMDYLKGTNVWTFVQGKVTPLSGATVCTLLCMMADCDGTVWFDDIFFRQE